MTLLQALGAFLKCIWWIVWWINCCLILFTSWVLAVFGWIDNCKLLTEIASPHDQSFNSFANPHSKLIFYLTLFLWKRFHETSATLRLVLFISLLSNAVSLSVALYALILLSQFKYLLAGHIVSLAVVIGALLKIIKRMLALQASTKILLFILFPKT